MNTNIVVFSRIVIAARNALGWNQKQCAHECGVSLSSLTRLEKFADVTDSVIKRVQDGLEAHGVQFNEGTRRISFTIIDRPTVKVDDKSMPLGYRKVEVVNNIVHSQRNLDERNFACTN